MEGVADWSDSPEQSFPFLKLDWVYSKVVGFTSTFLNESFVSSLLGRVPILKSDADDGILTVKPCRPTDTICISQSPSKRPFFLFVLLFVF